MCVCFTSDFPETVTSPPPPVIFTVAALAVSVVALNFIVGVLIGGVILIWRLAVAAWYIPRTIYRLLNVGRVGVAEIGEE